MFKPALIVLLLSFCLAVFAQTTIDNKVPLPVDPDLVIGKLANGLTYYIKVNHKPEKRAELRLVTNIGSVQEDDDQQGLAHFTEHMAFNGTKHFKKSELVDYMNSIGMGYANGLNAGTGLDQTTYQLQVPTDNAEQFRKGFLILSDWAAGVSFDTEEINKERGVIVEEWRMGQGADQRMSDAQRKVIFAGSKYAERMPIGKLEVLQNFAPETLRKFYSDWYRPDLQAVVAVGDFDAAVVENLIKEYFNPIPAQVNPRECLLYDVPDHKDPKVVITTDKEASDTSVQINWKHERTVTNTVSDYRQSLVTNLYTQMLNLRLQELAQKAEPPFSMAYNFSFNMVRSKSSYMMVAIVPETGVSSGLGALLTEAERINRFGFTQTELDRAKQVALRNAERMLAEKDKQDSDRLVWRYVGAFSYGNPIMSIDQNVSLNRSLYDGINLDDVNRISREMVTDSNMVIAVSAPQKDDLVLPSESDLLALVQQVKMLVMTPYEDKVNNEALLQQELRPGKLASSRNFKKAGVKQWKLSNGITVLYKQTDFQNDEILLSAFSPGGTSLYDLDDLFEARECANIISDSGVGAFDDTTLKKKLAGKIVRVEPQVDNESEGFTASCSKADLETMFQLIYLYATAPRLDADNFASWKAKQQAWLENSLLSPETVFFDSLSAFDYDYNPRVRSMQVEDLATIDQERVLQIYQERFADCGDFTFVIVGSFAEQQLKDFCLKYLANLPSQSKTEQVRDTGVRFTQGKKSFSMQRGQDAKSTVYLSMYEPRDITGKTRAKLRSLTFLMDEKLRENIRETRSGVYYVGAWGTTDKYPMPSCQISVYMQCAPERATELTDAVISTLDSLKAGLFTEKYVNVVKVTSQKRLETDLKDNRWWQSSIYDQVQNGFPLNDLLADRKLINKLNLKQLQSTARDFLVQDTRLVQGMLYPAPVPQE
jgi:zinc protease